MALEVNQVPYADDVIDSGRKLTRPWEQFFRKIYDLLQYIRAEQTFTLVNNQAAAADVTPLTFDKRYVSHAVVEYLIQRVSSSSELVAGGRLSLIYAYDADAWTIANTVDVNVGTIGVTFSVTADGQVRYTTTNQAGTIETSRMIFRVRQLQGKSNLYSRLG
jgi:hypothetical protein